MRAAAIALLAALATAAHGREPLMPGGAADRFLPVDEAFELQPAEWRDGDVRLSWRIAPGYYLYRDRFRIDVLQPAGLQVPALPFPPGEAYEDEIFGKVQVYRDRVELRLPLSAPSAPTLRVTYQGCADAGLCYPPQTRTVRADAAP